MNKGRIFCNVVVVFLVAIVGFSCKDKEKNQPFEVKKKPNFLFVLVDDQSPFDFKFYDSTSTLNAPTITQLAKEGLVVRCKAYGGNGWCGMYTIKTYDNER